MKGAAMTQSNVELIKEFYAAFARGDGDAALAALTEDVFWLEAENYPYADRNPYIGPQAVAEGVLARVPADWDEFVVVVEDVAPLGENRVFSSGRYRGVFRRTGKRIDAQMAHVWTLREGRIAGFQQYADTLQVVEATRSGD